MESIDIRHVFAMLCQSYYLAVMIKAYLELLHLTFWMAVTYPNCAHFLQISRSSKQGHQWCLSPVAWGFPPNASSLSSQSLPEKMDQSWPHFFHQTSKPLARSWWSWEVFGGFCWWNLNGTGWHRMKNWQIPTHFGQLALQMNYWSLGKQWGCMWRMVDGQIFNRVCHGEQLSTGQSSGRSEQDSFSVIVVSQPSSQRPIVEHRVSLSKPVTACMLLDAAAEKAQVERIWTRNNEQNRVLDRRNKRNKKGKHMTSDNK